MLVKCEALDGAAPDRDRELAHHIKSVIGISARVEVSRPGTLSRSEGKAKRVFDERPIR